MLLLHRWQRFFFALLVLIWGGIVLPSLIPSQAKAEPDQAGQTDVDLTGEKRGEAAYFDQQSLLTENFTSVTKPVFQIEHLSFIHMKYDQLLL